jgi:hypothetical protein
MTSASTTLASEPMAVERDVGNTRAGRLVLVISNPATAPDAQAVSGTVLLAKLKASDGPHQLQNLLTGANQPIAVSGYAATFPIAVARWDTLVLSLAQS